MNIFQGNSRLINWSGRLALLCLIMVPLSVLAVRLGVHFGTGLLMFALSCLLALVLIIVLVIASMLPRYRHYRRQALLNTLPAIPPVLLILAILGSSGDYPSIHDITTDTDDPPLFRVLSVPAGLIPGRTAPCETRYPCQTFTDPYLTPGSL